MDVTTPKSVAGLTAAESTTTRATRYVWALTRLCLGWTFLWPFLDKLFGLGHETTSAHAWINGGSPSFGFLSGATGPFASLYQSIAGAGVVNWLFMIGLLCIAVALLLGVGMRIAAVSRAILLVLMWSASLPPQDDIFMDNHIIYALVLVGLALVGDGLSAVCCLKMDQGSPSPRGDLKGAQASCYGVDRVLVT